MRNVWIVVASGLLAFANFVKSQETGQGGGGRTLYSSRYDNLDIDTILSSNRLVNNYVDCLLSRKPCPPEGKDLKRILPEALRTKCGRCSSTQKENALKIITTLYYSYPDQYQALRERWDPSGEYHRRFEEYLRGIQFNQIGGNGNGNGNNGNGPSERPFRQQSSSYNYNPNQYQRPCFTRCPSRYRPWSQQQQQQFQQFWPLYNSNSNSNSNNFIGFLIDTDSDSRPEAQTQDLAQNTSPTDNPNNFRHRQPSEDPSSVEMIRSPSSVDRTPFSRLILRPVDGLNFEPTTNIISTQPTVGPLSNRFGDDDSGAPLSTTPQRPAVQTTSQRPVVVRQTTARPAVTQRTTSRFVESVPAVQLVQGQFQVVAQPPPPPQLISSQNLQQPSSGQGQGQPSASVPNNVIDNFFIPPGVQQQNQNGVGGGLPQSPIVGLFNQIGNKLATTADAIAGMLRKTVDVIVTSHIQSHQRVLRSFGAQQ